LGRRAFNELDVSGYQKPWCHHFTFSCNIERLWPRIYPSGRRRATPIAVIPFENQLKRIAAAVMRFRRASSWQAQRMPALNESRKWHKGFRILNADEFEGI
jgi:hypothetical protein